MSTHSDSSPPGTSERPKRFKPHQLVIGIGCFMGLFTLVSGILPQLTNWHDENAKSREVFGGIPSALQVAFYTVIPVMLVGHRFADVFATGSAATRSTSHDAEERQLTPADFRRRLHAHVVARLGRGLMHSSSTGFSPARRHHRARGRPPDA